MTTHAYDGNAGQSPSRERRGGFPSGTLEPDRHEERDVVVSKTHRGGPPSRDLDRDPVVIFWELTRSCALACQHCRAEAQPKRHPMELDTAECFRVLRELTRFDTPPIVVLSGGDPFMRRDLFDIVARGVELGLTVSVSPSATALATEARLRRLVDLGVSRVSFSLDGPNAEVHDAFRGFAGTFDRTLAMFERAREVGLEFQVNTTITRQTWPHLPEMVDLVAKHGAVLWDLFLLVPVGRGLAEDLMSPEEHEQVFRWIAESQGAWPFRAKTTLGQHYRRVAVQKRIEAQGGHWWEMDGQELRRYWPGPPTNDGRGIFFISHVGNVYPSGFLPVGVGNVRRQHVVDMYRRAPLFQSLRDTSRLRGKCGVCPFNEICGGSRARAFATAGDALGAEPCCVFQPREEAGGRS